MLARRHPSVWNAAAIYTYDDNGNLLSDGTYQYVWDTRNQLIEIRQGGASLVTYSYDALGRRSSKQLGSSSAVAYVTDGANVVGESTASGYKQVVGGVGLDSRLSVYDSTGARYVVADAMHSTLGTLSASGVLSKPFTYSPFGETQGSAVDGFAYTGRDQDLPDLYYYRARYYKPSTGRFISEDPLGLAAGINIYAYVDANPMSLTDPTGLAPGDPFPSTEAAAIDALRFISAKSDRCSREYGGWIYKEWSLFSPPTYTYDEPAPLGKTGGNLPGMPEWHETDAMFHNHPLISGYDYNNFSFGDKETAAGENLPSYLLVPDGTIKRYTPGPGGDREGGSEANVGHN